MLWSLGYWLVELVLLAVLVVAGPLLVLAVWDEIVRGQSDSVESVRKQHPARMR